jgi:hypothetical protein
VADPGAFPEYAQNTDSDVRSSSVGTRGALHIENDDLYKEKIINIIDYLIDIHSRLYPIIDYEKFLISHHYFHIYRIHQPMKVAYLFLIF